MRNRTWIESVTLVFLAGCGVFSGEDAQTPNDPNAPPIVAPNDPPPAAPPLTGTPAPSEIDEKLGVFVAPSGTTDGEGTRAKPVASIAKGIEIAKQSGKRVYVCEGTYREAIVIENKISMVGGLDCSSASWAIANKRSRVLSPTTPAITADNVTDPTRFEGFDVIAPDATDPSGSSIGLFAVGSPALTVAKARIDAGSGAKGDDGIPAVQLVQSGNIDGLPGLTERDYCATKPDGMCQVNVQPAAGGAPGTSICTGAAVVTENGGAGGTGGVWKSNPADGAHVVAWWNEYQNNPVFFGAKAGVARSGAPAGSGTDGTSTQSAGALTKEGFVPAHGTRGTDGEPGKGGSGGNGYWPTASAKNQYIWYGNSGSGGGAGGCPGLAGGEGKGGGASIAAYLVDSAMTFEGVELFAKNGGAGGRGTFGSNPTPGGEGGPMVNGIATTAGKPGTAGGEAGSSGSGAGGSSFGLVHIGGAPTLTKTKPQAGTPGSGAPELAQGTTTIAASPSGVAMDVYEL